MLASKLHVNTIFFNMKLKNSKFVVKKIIFFLLEYYPWTAERRSQLSALLKLSISHGYKETSHTLLILILRYGHRFEVRF